MRIGVIGAGNMGGALGVLWARGGHRVVFSGSRDPARLERLARGSVADAGTPEEAVREADAVLVALQPHAWDAVLPDAALFNGKPVITCMSGLRPDFSGQTVGLPSTMRVSLAESLAERLPGAHVVEAFNLTFAEVLASDSRVFGGERPTLPFCGDNAGAKALVARLIADAGYGPLDVGPLVHARTLETLATVWVQLAAVSGLHPNVALRVLRR